MIPDFSRSQRDQTEALAGLSKEVVISRYRRERDGGDDEDVPVKVAEFAIFDEHDRAIGIDEPQFRFCAETLDRRSWAPAGDSILRAIDKLVLVHRVSRARCRGRPTGRIVLVLRPSSRALPHPGTPWPLALTEEHRCRAPHGDEWTDARRQFAEAIRGRKRYAGVPARSAAFALRTKTRNGSRL